MSGNKILDLKKKKLLRHVRGGGQGWDGRAICLDRANASDVVGDRRWEGGQGLRSDELVDFVGLGQGGVHAVHVGNHYQKYIVPLC